MATLLIAEDEKEMQNIIATFLTRDGHICLTADDGIDALTILKNTPVDLVILDISMPHLDGLSVCRIIRERGNLPVLFLTARESEEDRLKGYDYGADDYMTKPFSLKLLLAKVNALLRRSLPCTVSGCLTAGNIVLHPASRIVSVEGTKIDLTFKEFELLHFFILNPNQVFSREQLLNRIWGFDFEGNTRTVDTHIKTLRQKLGQEGRSIITLIRSGYKFEVKS